MLKSKYINLMSYEVKVRPHTYIHTMKTVNLSEFYTIDDVINDIIYDEIMDFLSKHRCPFFIQLQLYLLVLEF